MRFVVCITPLLVVTLAAQASAQEKENPIIAAVKANVKDASKPFTMLVHIKIKDGAAAKFEAAFAKAIRDAARRKATWPTTWIGRRSIRTNSSSTSAGRTWPPCKPT